MISALELSTQWYDGEGTDDLIGGGMGFEYWEMEMFIPADMCSTSQIIFTVYSQVSWWATHSVVIYWRKILYRHGATAYLIWSISFLYCEAYFEDMFGFDTNSIPNTNCIPPIWNKIKCTPQVFVHIVSTKLCRNPLVSLNHKWEWTKNTQYLPYVTCFSLCTMWQA